MAGSMVYRLRVGSLDDAHMKRFRQAMDKMQAIGDKRGFNYVAGFHGVPDWDCWHHQRNQHNPRVRARLFLPWHRAYLWWLEQAMQDQVDGTALPWWDWTTQRGVPPAYAGPKVGSNRNSLYNSRINLPEVKPPVNRFTTRDPGRPSGLPTPRNVETLLDESDWGTFSDGMESIHDDVHGWVGGRTGDMGQLDFAAYDPIFFAHHCMIDRLWYLWQTRHGKTRITPGLLDMELIPFGKRVSDVIDVEPLGYEYAATAVAINVGEAQHA
jgi:tyrosinase